MIDVSFIITNYNYDRYISECISSCLNQNETNLSHEVIVVDDGSTDNSIETIVSYKNCKLIRNKNMGVERAANQAVFCANGDFVVRVDADDLVSSYYLNYIQEYLFTDFDVLYGNYTEIDTDSQKLNVVQLPDFDAKEILKRGDFLATGTLYRKNAIISYGPYNTLIKNNGLENYELIIKMIKNKHKFKKINSSLFYYRHHSKNMSITRYDQIMSYGQKIYADYGFGTYQIGTFHPYMKRITK